MAAGDSGELVERGLGIKVRSDLVFDLAMSSFDLRVYMATVAMNLAWPRLTEMRTRKQLAAMLRSKRWKVDASLQWLSIHGYLDQIIFDVIEAEDKAARLARKKAQNQEP